MKNDESARRTRFTVDISAYPDLVVIYLGLLRKHLPQRVGVDRGIIVDAKGNTSKRQDVVIYDRTVEGQRLGLEILIRRQEPRVLLYCFKGSPHTLT